MSAVSLRLSLFDVDVEIEVEANPEVGESGSPNSLARA